MNRLQSNRAATEKAAFHADDLLLGEQSALLGFAAPPASKPIHETKEQQITVKQVTNLLWARRARKWRWL
jgi:hypothetical protein